MFIIYFVVNLLQIMFHLPPYIVCFTLISDEPKFSLQKQA